MFPHGTQYLRTALCLGFASIVLTTASVNTAQAKEKPQAAAPGSEPVISTDLKTPGKRFMKARVIINASPQVVWESVHEERKHDPDLEYSKVVEEKGNVKTLEQKFNLIPVIGSATCVMHQDEVPFQRIDYSMLKSDRFKAFEGSWVLIPSEDGATTTLELSSRIDMGLPIPRSIMEGFQTKKMARRLDNVRKAAEALQARTLATK